MPERPQYQIDRDRAQRHTWKQERDLQAQKAASSRPGQVYHEMTSLANRMTSPGYQNTKADIAQLKGLRRDWNRNQKYTPYGMQVSGATTGREAQDIYGDLTRDLRQGNNPAYTNMYPITGNFLNVMDKGGIFGAILSEIGDMTRKDNKGQKKGKKEGKGFWGDLQQMGSDIFGGVGIGGAVSRDEATEEVLKNYADKTFGHYPTDMHPGTYDIYDRSEDIEDHIDDINAPIKRIQEEVYEGPWPHKEMPTFPDIYRGPTPHKGLPPLDVYEGLRPHEGMPLLPVEAGQPPLGAVDVTGEWVSPGRKEDIVDDITVEDRMPGSWLFPGNILNLFKKDKVIPGYTTSYVDRFAPIDEEIVEEVIPPIPFDDSGRESGIRGLVQDLKPNKYEDEFRAYIEGGGDFMPYHQFERMYEKIYQGKPHALHSSYR